MQQQEHEKAFEKSLNYLAQRHGIRQVFEAAIDLTLFNLILTDEAGLRKNPLQDYTEDEKQELVKCLEALGEIMENGGQGMYDALGDLFMEYLSFGKNGQFFYTTADMRCNVFNDFGNSRGRKNSLRPDVWFWAYAFGSGKD